MNPQTILVRSLAVMTASRLVQVLHRTHSKGEEVRARHQNLCRFATLLVLVFTDLACRNPAEEPQKTVVQITRFQEGTTTKESDAKAPPVGQLVDRSIQSQPSAAGGNDARKDAAESAREAAQSTREAAQGARDKVAGDDKAGSEPVISGVKVVAAALPSQPAGTANDSKTTQPTAEQPANQLAPGLLARSDKDRGEPVSIGGKGVKALTPKTVTPEAEPTQAGKGPEAVHTRAKSPADQAALAQVALNDKDWTVRKAAVEGLTHQGVLAKVSLSDEDLDIRKLAVSRLTVQAALAKVATSDKDWSVRRAATALLTDQGVLARIALVDPDSDIRKLAVSLLTDQAALTRVARSDKDWSVRRLAVSKLTSPRSLTQVATNDEDSDIRKLAVSRLINPTATPESDQDN